jgi:hypothetical protein
MNWPTRIIIPISEVRLLMGIRLTVLPRYKLTALGKPRDNIKDTYRREVIEHLTEGWENWTIMRNISRSEAANLPSLIAQGRAMLPPED